MALVKKTDFPLISGIIADPKVSQAELEITCDLNLEQIKSTLNSTVSSVYNTVGCGQTLPPKIVTWINEHSELFAAAPRSKVTEYKIEFSNDVGSVSLFSIRGTTDDEKTISLCCKIGKATVPIPQKTELVRDYYIGVGGGGAPQYCPDIQSWTECAGGQGVGPGWTKDLMGSVGVYVSRYNNPGRGNPWAWFGDRWYTRALNAAEMTQVTAYLAAHLK